MKRSDPLTKREWRELTTLTNDLALLSFEGEIPRKFRDMLVAMRVVVKRISANHDAIKYPDADGFGTLNGVDHQYPKSIRERWEATK